MSNVPDDNGETIQTFSHRVYADCVRLVYKNRERSLFSVYAVSVVPVILAWSTEALPVTLVMAALLWVYATGSLVQTRRYKAGEPSSSRVLFAGRVFYFQLAFLALLLNGAFLYLDASGIDSVLFLILVTTGFSAGAVGAYHPLKGAGTTFVLFATVPQLVYYPAQGVPHAWVLVALLIIFVGFMVVVDREQHRNAVAFLVAKYELQASRDAAEGMAREDVLTGLKNRRAFFENVPALLAESGEPVSLLAADIDFFKSVNDTFGHGAGDRALASFARILHAHSRENDVAARLGGEEFAILLPGTGPGAAWEFAEKIRIAFRELDLGEYGITRPVTTSLGIAVFRPGSDSIESLLERADCALYRAKAQGRDRTVLYKSSETMRGHGIGVRKRAR